MLQEEAAALKAPPEVLELSGALKGIIDGIAVGLHRRQSSIASDGIPPLSRINDAYTQKRSKSCSRDGQAWKTI
jgi:hypothetical protein